jgi:hypothetical protein
MRLGRNEKSVLIFLAEMSTEFHSPTNIGTKVTGDPAKHSAWACPILKRLVAKGLVEKNEARHYRITEAGMKLVEERKWREKILRRPLTPLEVLLLAQFLPNIPIKLTLAGPVYEWEKGAPTPEQVAEALARVQQQATELPPANPEPWPAPFPGPLPIIPPEAGGPFCHVCGIDMSKATHYCCQRPDCPSRVFCGDGPPPTIICEASHGSTQESSPRGGTEALPPMQAKDDLPEHSGEG